MRVFGPVPSRRLGRSLGVNNIPPKICSYTCVYCQIGRSTKLSVQLQDFYNPEDLANEILQKLEKLSARNEKVDYVSFVPDGEPTLDKNLGLVADLISSAGVKTAIITNSSTIHLSSVRENLKKFDWVSLKVDSVKPDIWHKIDRPHKSIDFDKMLEGLLIFSKEFNGTLVTETMLVKDINDQEDNLCKTSMFISQLNPKVAYISVPTRPPAENWVLPPDTEIINQAFNIFKNHIDNVELLINYEGSNFTSVGNVAEDLLSIISVHPITQEALDIFLRKYQADYSIVEELINNNLVIKTEYNGKIFYLRNLGKYVSGH